MAERKLVGREWKWFTDYVYLYSAWTLNAETGRRCEVGMGVKAFGTPRGQRKKFSGHVSFTTVGLGAIHVRVIDDNEGECLVQLDQGDVGPIRISGDF